MLNYKTRKSTKSYEASNERFVRPIDSRGKKCEKLSLKTRENYESKLKNVGSEVETFCTDLNNMMVGIEEEIAAKVKKIMRKNECTQSKHTRNRS